MTTLPVFRAGLDPRDVESGGIIRLSGAEARHAGTVQRLGEGARLDVVDGAGLRVTAQVLGVRGDEIELRALHSVREPARDPQLVLVQALAKGDRDLQAVESCTELGVDAVIPWQAERSIARLRPERQDRQLAKWDSTVTAAAKQSRRARWPVLEPPVDSRGLAELMERAEDTRWLVLHEAAAHRILDAVASAAEARGRIALVVGPEGGVSPRELEAFEAAGARAVRLGPEVLRSSTAGVAALAVLSAGLGRW